MRGPYYIWKLSLLGITQFVENGHEVVIIVSWIGVILTFECGNPLFKRTSGGLGRSCRRRSIVESSVGISSLELNSDSGMNSILNNSRFSSDSLDSEKKSREELRVRGVIRNSPGCKIIRMTDRQVLITVTPRRIDPSTKRCAGTTRSPDNLLSTRICTNRIRIFGGTVRNSSIPIPSGINNIIGSRRRWHDLRTDSNRKRPETQAVKHHTSKEKTSRCRNNNSVGTQKGKRELGTCSDTSYKHR